MITGSNLIAQQSPAVWRVLPKPHNDQVALTFDDGPSPKTTPKILDILKKCNVKATFFLVGKMVKQYPNLVKRILQEGHTVGNHGYHHRQLHKQSARTIRKEITDTNKHISLVKKNILEDNLLSSNLTAMLRNKVVFFRPPYGSYDHHVVQTAKDLGMKVILWDIDPKDWKNPSPQRINDRIQKHVRSGGIVLLHDFHKNTVKALPSIITDLHKKQYSLVSLDQIIEHSDPQKIVCLKK